MLLSLFFFRRPLHKKTCTNLSIIVKHPIIFIFITLVNHSHKTSVVNARFPFTKTSRKLRRKEAIRVKNLFHSFPSLRNQPGMEHAFSTEKFPTGKPRAILIKIHLFPGIFQFKAQKNVRAICIPTGIFEIFGAQKAANLNGLLHIQL